MGCLGHGSPWGAPRSGDGADPRPRSLWQCLGLPGRSRQAPWGRAAEPVVPVRLPGAPGCEGSQLCSGSLRSTWLFIALPSLW